MAARPQCPSCGRKKLRDPHRAPAPVELGAGGKVVMTSGGYRSVSPAATVARLRRHVSPPAETVHELRAGLSSGSFGKGSTAELTGADLARAPPARHAGV